MSKYDPLFRHLRGREGAASLSFEEIGAMIGFPLPPSATQHAAWWSNSRGHVLALECVPT